MHIIIKSSNIMERPEVNIVNDNIYRGISLQDDINIFGAPPEIFENIFTNEENYISSYETVTHGDYFYIFVNVFNSGSGSDVYTYKTKDGISWESFILSKDQIPTNPSSSEKFFSVNGVASLYNGDLILFCRYYSGYVLLKNTDGGTTNDFTYTFIASGQLTESENQFFPQLMSYRNLSVNQSETPTIIISNNDINSTDIYIAKSSDGLNWTEYQIPKSTLGGIKQIKYAPKENVFLALRNSSVTTGYSHIMTSNDGTSWQNMTLSGIGLSTISVSNGIFVAFGGTGSQNRYIYTSDSGTEWSDPIDTEFSEQLINKISNPISIFDYLYFSYIDGWSKEIRTAYSYDGGNSWNYITIGSVPSVISVPYEIYNLVEMFPGVPLVITPESARLEKRVNVKTDTIFRDFGSTNSHQYFNIESSEIIQPGSSEDYFTSFDSKYLSKIVDEYSKGKDTVRLKVAYSEYRDENDNIVYTGKDGKIIKVGDVIEPYYYKDENNKNAPLLTYADGTPKQFLVTGSEINAGKSIYVNLDVVEIT